jgi:hypothetical protein
MTAGPARSSRSKTPSKQGDIS